jgi:hypothetical protein
MKGLLRMTKREAGQPAKIKTELLEDLPIHFYVETATGWIYEGKRFPDFMILRAAHPSSPHIIQRVHNKEFDSLFREYDGDPDLLRAQMREMAGNSPVD